MMEVGSLELSYKKELKSQNMILTLTTPALLFPTISLLLLAYTNRFLALASLIRKLHYDYSDQCDEKLRVQIKMISKRMTMIRQMQFLGVSSMNLCIVSMLSLFLEYQLLGKILFAISLLLMIASLTISMREISLSGNALKVQLDDLLKPKKQL